MFVEEELGIKKQTCFDIMAKKKTNYGGQAGGVGVLRLQMTKKAILFFSELKMQ